MCASAGGCARRGCVPGGARGFRQPPGVQNRNINTGLPSHPPGHKRSKATAHTAFKGLYADRQHHYYFNTTNINHRFTRTILCCWGTRQQNGECVCWMSRRADRMHLIKVSRLTHALNRSSLGRREGRVRLMGSFMQCNLTVLMSLISPTLSMDSKRRVRLLQDFES